MKNNSFQSIPGMEEYFSTMDALQFSDAAKARMSEQLTEAACATSHTAQHMNQLGLKKRTFLPMGIAAALVLALLMGGVAYASGTLVSVQSFVNHLFGVSEAQVEIVDTIGRPIGVSQSSNGVTISADAIIGDKRNLALVFSISKDDGTAFEDIEAFEDGRLSLGLSDDLDIDFPFLWLFRDLGAVGSSYTYDANPNDNEIQLVVTRSYSCDAEDFSLIGRTLTARFSDIVSFTKDGVIPLVSGNWTLRFPLNFEDTSRALPQGQSCVINGIDATIDEAEISPIALHMKYTAQQKVEWTSNESGRQSEHDSQLADSLLGVDVTLVMRDGTSTVIHADGSGSVAADGDVARCETSIMFDQIVNLDELAAVVIGGTSIAL